MLCPLPRGGVLSSSVASQDFFPFFFFFTTLSSRSMQQPSFKIPDAARPPPILFTFMRMAPKLAYWGLPLAIGGKKF